MDSRDDHAACEATRDALARELADVRRELEQVKASARTWRRVAQFIHHAAHPDSEEP